jgi:hypothetical protein
MARVPEVVVVGMAITITPQARITRAAMTITRVLTQTIIFTTIIILIITIRIGNQITMTITIINIWKCIDRSIGGSLQNENSFN